jgi:hypothetical protein
MDIIPNDCYHYIGTFLTWPDSRSMSLVLKISFDYELKHLYDVSVIILRFVRRIASYKALMRLFVDRCVNDVAYRSKYLYIHQTEYPHLCFRCHPRWMSKNPYRFNIRSFLTKEQEEMMHVYISTIVEISTI